MTVREMIPVEALTQWDGTRYLCSGAVLLDEEPRLLIILVNRDGSAIRVGVDLQSAGSATFKPIPRDVMRTLVGTPDKTERQAG